MLVHSYRSAFILLITAVLVVSVAAVTWNAYRRASEVSLDLSAEIIAGISRTSVERTAGLFESVRGYLEINALEADQGDLIAGQEQLLRLFWTELQLTPQLISVFAADSAGNFVQARELPQRSTRIVDRSETPPRASVVFRDKDFEPISHIDGTDLYDPRNRPWYRNRNADRAIQLSELYRFDATGKPGITATKALLDDSGSIQVVLGADITLESLSQFLAEQSFARNGVAMIVDRQGRLIAFPHQLRLTSERDGQSREDLPVIDDLAEAWVADAYHALQGGQLERTRSGRGEYAISMSRGVRYIAHVEDLSVGQGAEWKLFVVVPQRALLSAANRLLSESVALSLIILAAALLVVYAVASRFFRPARQLAHNAALIRSFRLEEVQPLRSAFREVQIVDEAIYGLKQGLQALSRFLPPDVVRQLIWSDQEPAREAETRELALLFFGFPDLHRPDTELSAEQIAKTLTERVERCTRLVLEEEGTVDRYLSDTLMAFWAAPEASADEVERACRLALRCRGKEETAESSAPGATRAGSSYAVHSGPALVGNVGGSHRLSFTAVGDHVELAYRLRQLNRHYGIPILVSDAAQRQVARRFWWRRVDVVPVDETGGELAVYELVNERETPLTDKEANFIRGYEAGLEALRARRWQEALESFRALEPLRPGDRSLAIMLQRCYGRDARGCPWSESQGGNVAADQALGESPGSKGRGGGRNRA